MARTVVVSDASSSTGQRSKLPRLRSVDALNKSTNTKIRLLPRVAFGLHEPPIALAVLALGGHTPKLPD